MQYTSGGPGGSRTRVRSTFLLASYNYNLVLNIGFELMTYRLQGGCSTTELTRRGADDQNRTDPFCLEGRGTTNMQHPQRWESWIRTRDLEVNSFPLCLLS